MRHITLAYSYSSLHWILNQKRNNECKDTKVYA